MEKKQIYKLLDLEIEWCKESPQKGAFEKGFIEGLRQAKRLIRKMKLNEK